MQGWRCHSVLKFLVILTCCLGFRGFASEPPDPLATLGFKDLVIISQRLMSNLSKAEAKEYASDPLVEDPAHGIVFTNVQSGNRSAARVSDGSVTFLNRISYAMAANRFQKGYLQSYLNILARYDGIGDIPELPADPALASRASELSNDHLSNFNQISAGILSIVLNANSLPVKDLPSEQWIKSLRKGIPNSLTSAYGIEGLADFFDALEKMPLRPAWVEQFIPSGIKAARARKELKRIYNNLLR